MLSVCPFIPLTIYKTSSHIRFFNFSLCHCHFTVTVMQNSHVWKSVNSLHSFTTVYIPLSVYLNARGLLYQPFQSTWLMLKYKGFSLAAVEQFVKSPVKQTLMIKHHLHYPKRISCNSIFGKGWCHREANDKLCIEPRQPWGGFLKW